MSSHKLEFTTQSRRDLKTLSRYSTSRWGKHQSEVYMHRLEASLQRLTIHPLLGEERTHLVVGLRAFPVGQHIIFYSVLPDTVRVVRILHERMNPADHL